MREIGRVSGVAGNIMSFDGIVLEIIKNPQANSGSISGPANGKDYHAYPISGFASKIVKYREAPPQPRSKDNACGTN